MGETDISGLGLRQAHLGLDWAAEGLDLTSPAQPFPTFILINARAFSLNAPQPMHRALSHKVTYSLYIHTHYLKHTAPTQLHHNNVIFS